MRHQGSDNFPPCIGQIASITQLIAAMLPPGGRCPHEGLQTGFDNRLESHLSPIIHHQFDFQDGLSKTWVWSRSIKLE